MEGDPVDGIFFIKEGQAAFVERRPSADVQYATLSAGQHFGNLDFINMNDSDKKTRNFTVKAITDMDLLFLQI